MHKSDLKPAALPVTDGYFPDLAGTSEMDVSVITVVIAEAKRTMQMWKAFIQVVATNQIVDMGKNMFQGNIPINLDRA
jgi:hypothetical protein